MLLAKPHLLHIPVIYMCTCVVLDSVYTCLFFHSQMSMFVMRSIRKVVVAAVSRLLIGRLLCINFKELEMYNSWLFGGFCKSPSCVQLLICMTWKTNLGNTVIQVCSNQETAVLMQLFCLMFRRKSQSYIKNTKLSGLLININLPNAQKSVTFPSVEGISFNFTCLHHSTLK